MGGFVEANEFTETLLQYLSGTARRLARTPKSRQAQSRVPPACGGTLLDLLAVLSAGVRSIFASSQNPPNPGFKRAVFVFVAFLLLTGGNARAQGVNEPPVVTGEVSIEYAENGEGKVTTYTATDPEEESITWFVSGTDGTVFSITVGVLEFLTPPNYENPADQDGDNIYEVEVVATDSSGASGTIAVTITVTDVNDPNIVLIMADAVGYEAFGAYGSTQYRTPRIDALAAEGVRFTNAYSKPSCTPSRVALMTGKSNVRNYVDFSVLLPGQYTIADLFREAGYATAIAGKWQLHGRPTTVTGVAAGTGFDTYCLWHTANTSRRRYWMPSIECDGEIIDSYLGDYGPDLFVDFLLEFIESNQERPFFAYYSMVLPHHPFEPPPQAQCPGEDDDQCNFEDMIAYLDHNIGRIRDKLADLELLDNTILVFTSDNGTDRRLVSDLRGEMIHGDKQLPTDGGTRVPLIVRAPGVRAGVLDDLIDFTDFLPTLADAAGLTIPDGNTLDGVSFWDRLQGNPGRPREWIYTYYFPNPYVSKFDNPYYHPEMSYVRDKRYKLYGTGELYDVSVDRHEVHPLPSDDGESRAARNKLQAALDSMPERGQQILWSHVTAVASTAVPFLRWRPVLSKATVDGAELTLTYAGVLDTSVTPPVGSFTVNVDGSERTVFAVSINDRAVTLTLAPAVMADQTVTVSYTPGTGAISHANRPAGKKAAALVLEAVTDETESPPPPPPPTTTVSGIRISSSPGTDRTYAAGDEIRVTVTFSETVEVTGTPQLRLRVGSSNQTAAYLRGTDTEELVFGYEVADGREDTDGVSIEAGRITLNGGTIKDEADNPAELAHEAVAAQAGHKVDGVRPVFVSAAVDGSSLTLTYGETLDGGSRPAPGDFTVEVDGAGRSVTGVSVSGSVVTLTLSTAVEHGDTGIRVSYTPGTNPIQDAVGNDARGLSNQAVTNTTGAPNTAPEIATVGPFTVPENQALVRRLAARDDDSGDEVTGWSIIGGADQSQFSITSDTGDLSFQEAPDYESPTDVVSGDPPSGAGDNEYVVTVEVRSGAGARELEAEQTFTVRVTDEREPPGIPEAPAFSGETADSLTVHWRDPENTGPVITDYDVRYRKKGPGRFIDAQHMGPGLSLTLDDLEPGTAYEVQVRATNDEGASDWSESGEGMTVTPLTVEMMGGTEPPVEGPFTVRFSFSEPVRGFTQAAIETAQDPACTDEQNNPVFCEPDIGRLETVDDRVFNTTVTPQTDRVAHNYTLTLTVSGGAVRSSVGNKLNEEAMLGGRVAPPGVTVPISEIGLTASGLDRAGRLNWNRHRMTEARRSSAMSTGMRPWGRCGTTGKTWERERLASLWGTWSTAWSTALRCVRSTRSARVRWRRRRRHLCCARVLHHHHLLLRARAKRCRTRPRIWWRMAAMSRWLCPGRLRKTTGALPSRITRSGSTGEEAGYPPVPSTRPIRSPASPTARPTSSRCGR